MLNVILFVFTPLVFLLFSSISSASIAERFAPYELQQNGKITLTPVFTPDGQQIFFAQSECSPIWECPQRLKTSYLTDSGWSAPKLVKLPTEDRVDWPNITPDGKTLIFSWAAKRPEYENLDIDTNFDLYQLDLTKSDAQPIPFKDADINRPRSGKVKTLRYVHNESYPSITLNGDLYFMTERLDGIGERDIYFAKKNQLGNFETARPLPFPINSENRDDGVWVNPTGNLMLLTYDYRGGLGSGDIFVSIKQGGEWQIPVNAGPTINSNFADFGAKLNHDETKIVFTSNRPVEGQQERILQVWVADFDKNLYMMTPDLQNQ